MQNNSKVGGTLTHHIDLPCGILDLLPNKKKNIWMNFKS